MDIFLYGPSVVLWSLVHADNIEPFIEWMPSTTAAGSTRWNLEYGAAPTLLAGDAENAFLASAVESVTSVSPEVDNERVRVVPVVIPDV